MSLPEREPTRGRGPKPPSSQELAAIIAAYDQFAHRPGVEEEVTQRAEHVWKFANRWWNRSSVAGRGRPRRPGAFS